MNTSDTSAEEERLARAKECLEQLKDAGLDEVDGFAALMQLVETHSRSQCHGRRHQRRAESPQWARA